MHYCVKWFYFLFFDRKNMSWIRGTALTYSELVCATTVFVPSFHNYRIWSFLGLGMTTYTAWYMTIAAIAHGQVSNAKYSGLYFFSGASLI